MIDTNDMLSRESILNITALASRYCVALERARDYERNEFVTEMLATLPRLYVEFSDFDLETLPSQLDDEYFPSYVDEDFYDSIRRNAEAVLAPDDVYLETFEEDMKYSDTPIAASISESLADIFQPLYNFLMIVKESDGEQSAGAMRECKENFEAYWSQTLCNVMRPLNNLRYN